MIFFRWGSFQLKEWGSFRLTQTLHRKNSLFYKTEYGAYVGDLFMSIIHTCSLCKVNPFEYLKALQEHSSSIAENPEKWMPWNYRQMLKAQGQ